MTDNEIIKALECCCSEEIQCRNCPLPQNVKDGLECGTVIAKDCLNLINRQKAEIKSLQERNVVLRGTVDCQKAEIDELVSNAYKSKAEAIKEFAELVKRNHGALFNTIYSRRFGEIIDNLVKEMVGDNNG